MYTSFKNNKEILIIQIVRYSEIYEIYIRTFIL